MHAQLEQAIFETPEHMGSYSTPLLNREELHIWKLNLKASLPDFAESTLGNKEYERYQRIIPQQQKQCFLAGRFWLRTILAEYLYCPMHELRLATGDKGKPFLAEPASQLEFNLSHTGNEAVLAIAANTPVGIDLEIAREKLNLVRIARTLFQADEIDQLEALSGKAQADYFFTCWTIMEARQKCLGLGIFNDKVSARQVATKTWRLGDSMLLSAAWANREWQPQLRLLLPPGN
jgi:4'-phosphopantetheinyl transferase